MGPEDPAVSMGSFSDKIPPSFNGRDDYTSYHEDVMLWTNLTSLASSKQAPALVGRLSGEAKASAKTLTLSEICAEDGVSTLLRQLDKSYAVDACNRLDTDLATFLDYTWKRSMTVEQFIAGFHSRLDKIATLNIDDKLKGHLLLRQATLQLPDKNMLIGAASGSYDVKDLTAAMRNAFIKQSPADASMNSNDNSDGRTLTRPPLRRDAPRRNDRTPNDRSPNDSRTQNNSARPSFYTFKTSSPTDIHGAILDSGACASVVGKVTLDRSLRAMGLDDIPNGKTSRETHRFGNHDETHRTLCAIKFPFKCADESGQRLGEYDITFDVIDGELPFLVGLPSLLAMRAALNFRYHTVGINLGDAYVRMSLVLHDSHLLLPFDAVVKRDNGPQGPGRQNSQRSASSHYQPAPYDSIPSATCSTRSANASTANSSAVTTSYTPSASGSPDLSDSYRPEKTDDTPPTYHAELTRQASDQHAMQLGTYTPPGSGSLGLSDSYRSEEIESTPPSCYADNVNHKSRQLTSAELRTLHVQLKHATATQLTAYIRSAGIWSNSLKTLINDVVNSCKCRLAFPPSPHPVASPTPLNEDIQLHLSVDVVFLGGHQFLHCLDRVSGWSEIGMLCQRNLAEQVRLFQRIQIHRHGMPQTILSDQEYNKGAFKSFCDESNILLVPVPAHAHQSNGAVERANRTLRSHYNRLLSCTPGALTVDLVHEAVYAKNINRGSRLASSFELLYGRSPLLSGKDLQSTKHIATVRENNSHIMRHRINKILRSQIRDATPVLVNEDVYIWRDNEGWIGPARVTKVNLHDIEVSHNGSTKSSSMNRVRKIGTVHESVTHPQDSDSPPFCNTSDTDATSATPPIISPVPDEYNTFPFDVYDDELTANGIAVGETNDAPRPVFDDCDDEPITPSISDEETEGAPHTENAAVPNASASGSNTNDRILRSQSRKAMPTDIPGTLPSLRNSGQTSHSIPAHEVRDLVSEGNAFIERPSHNPPATNHIPTTNADFSTRNSPYDIMTHYTTNQYPVSSAEIPVLTPSQPLTSNYDNSFLGTTGSQRSVFPKPLDERERRLAYDREYGSWVKEKAFLRVERSSVGRNANIIGSHTIYRRKDDGTAKARIVPWGHRDTEKSYLRSDSPCVNLEIFRLVLSLAAENEWILGQMDVATAFLQAKGFHRTIFVKPPREADDPSGLWKLMAAAYGLVDSGRLWYRTSDQALVSEHGLTRSRYEPTLYFHHSNGTLIFILVAQVDNYIYAGDNTEVASFEKFLQKRFHVGALDRHRFTVMGCELVQSESGSITMMQRSRLADIDENTLTADSPDTKQPADSQATKKELHNYRSTLGKMLYIGRMSQPIMLYHASHMATKIGSLRSHHLKDLRALIRFDKKHVPTLSFNTPSTKSRFTLEAVSDASMSTIAEGGGRGAFVIVRRNGDITHPIYWSARKLRRVARSSATAELLAASDAASSLIYLQHLLSEITYRHDSAMYVDSRAILNLSTSIREPAEAANKIDLAFIRESFTPQLISSFCWIPGYHNVADGMTKDNRTSAALLLRMLREGVLPHHPETVRIMAEPALGNYNERPTHTPEHDPRDDPSCKHDSLPADTPAHTPDCDPRDDPIHTTNSTNSSTSDISTHTS